MSGLKDYLNRPVSDLVADSPRMISTEEQERHRVYSQLLMAMVAHSWNPNKRGVDSNLKPSTSTDYGQNPLLTQNAKRGQFLRNDYLGHNIAAIAVDRDGYIIDFDFNHNEIFNSSVEHAESRLLRRLFSLTPLPPDPPESARHAALGFLVGGVTMPTVCFLTAWRRGFRHAFVVPVVALVIAAIETLRIPPP